MYLLLKASKANVQNHPIIKRLYQYRQLLSQLEPVFEEIVKPQIEIMLKEMVRTVVCDFTYFILKFYKRTMNIF